MKTPLTDAAEDRKHLSPTQGTVPSSFARQLEEKLSICRTTLGIQPEDEIPVDQTPTFGSILVDHGSSRRRISPTTEEAIKLEGKLQDAQERCVWLEMRTNQLHDENSANLAATFEERDKLRTDNATLLARLKAQTEAAVEVTTGLHGRIAELEGQVEALGKLTAFLNEDSSAAKVLGHLVQSYAREKQLREVLDEIKTDAEKFMSNESDSPVDAVPHDPKCPANDGHWRSCICKTTERYNKIVKALPPPPVIPAEDVKPLAEALEGLIAEDELLPAVEQAGSLPAAKQAMETFKSKHKLS